MIYKFKSKSGGDVIMMGPNGDHLLKLLGRSPAPTGIIESAHMPQAIADLERAVAEEEAEQERARAEAEAEGREPPRFEGVGLRQRVWPMVELMKRAHRNGHDIVWGV